MTTIDSSALNSWGFLSDLGCVLVIIGIIGESAELIVKWGKMKKFREGFAVRFDEMNRRRLVWFVKIVSPKILPVETVFVGMVVFGLAIEFLGTHKANGILYRNNSELLATNMVISSQVAGLNKEAADEGLKAAILAKQLNETIATQGTILKVIAPPDLSDILFFEKTLKTVPGVRVELRFIPEYREQITAHNLSVIFSNASWTVSNSRSVNLLGENGILIGANGDADSIKAAQCLAKSLDEKKALSVVIDNVPNVPSNSIIVVVCPPPDPFSEFLSQFENGIEHKNERLKPLEEERNEKQIQLWELEKEATKDPMRYFKDGKFREKYDTLRNGIMELWVKISGLKEDRMSIMYRMTETHSKNLERELGAMSDPQ